MFGKVAKIGLALVLCSGVAIGGLFATGVLGIPDAGLADNEWGEVDDERIEVITTAWIDNPNPGIELDGVTVDYDLAMNDVDLAAGTVEDVSVPSGNSTTEIRTDLRYQQLPDWWVAHVQNDELSDLEADVTAHVALGPLSGSPSYTHTDEVETDLEPMIAEAMGAMEGTHSLSPVGTGEGPLGEFVEPTVEIRDTDATWGNVTENRTELHLTYEVHNPNAYPLPTPALTGELEFNDRFVAEWDAHDVELLHGGYDAVIPPRTSREITFVADLENDDVVDWFATHVDNEEFTDAELRAQLAMNVNGETLTIPDDEDAIQCSFDMRTDIFVDQDAGIDRTDCDLVPWVTPDRSDFEDLGATLSLSEDTLLGLEDGDDSSDGTDDTSDGIDGSSVDSDEGDDDDGGLSSASG
ncbi:LEA type 2 family protein [Halopiger goleimassiliensis]|uniref:LEA type 2 family protein n=1 Tax=Halopiger goleimassiliensis TaxID=1293048 RepID=UPI00067764C3|nr:LEA type 2 family protein [Halopiger goleimassiliensis]